MPTAKPSIRLRIIFPPKNRSVDQRPATRQPGRLRFPYQGTLDEHRNDDDGTLDSADQIFADEIRQQHDIADDLEYERPQIAPQMRPTPPRSAVPPTTTAVMACNSHISPVVADVDPRRGT